ncbi:MAG: cation transporter [Ignavibacteriota bacterium]|nr:MAG: cation transporter [Chlorobiota bacterium]MBE7476904.1 cation transporter [Ignavibacteriales bacterium]MBL1121845.1 cation transporter [Ignavibacteriota bacterium]MEB2297600.1 cation diffusion facilitator family transporter [Ignavibacteria bacterium]GJQ41503.1 MAG: cobalt transporter [Ignavibacteriaceae bacterium]
MTHNHSHTHNTENYSRAFIIGIALNFIYILIEVVYGVMINSMALIADAGHNFSDVLGLLLAWGAAYLAKSAATKKRTYGFRKSTILAALFNAILLLIAVGAIAIEAVRKFFSPEPVQGSVMMIVAAIGVVVNAVTAFLFIKGREKDLNIHGAFLHMAADAGVSLGVVLAGLIIVSTGWLWVDPAISLVIVVVITVGTWGLLRDSFHLSMDAVPKGIDLNQVSDYLQSINGVKEVHDLHIWAMSTTEIALTAHLVIPDETKDDFFLKKICVELHSRFGIEHSTIQVEKSAQSANCEHRNV